jgi:hypothetical protein
MNNLHAFRQNLIAFAGMYVAPHRYGGVTAFEVSLMLRPGVYVFETFEVMSEGIRIRSLEPNGKEEQFNGT